MGFQQLFGGVGAHLRGDYAGKVFLHVHLVDRDDTFIGRHEVQRSLEALILLSLPVKIHADRDREIRELLGTGSPLLSYRIEGRRDSRLSRLDGRAGSGTMDTYLTRSLL